MSRGIPFWGQAPHVAPRYDVPSDDAVGQEVEGLRAECEWQSEKFRFLRRLWWFVHTLLGLPSAVLAGISGATGLSSEAARVPAAVLALISAGLGAAIAFLKPEARERKAQAYRNAFLVLETEARYALTQAASSGEHVALSVYGDLLERRRVIAAGQADELLST
jgi:hypothetical protein